MALVRPTLVSLAEVDLAMATKLAGISITLLESGSTQVPVLLEDDWPPEKARYPRLTVELIGEDEDFEDHEASDDVYEAAYDDTQDPPERTMRTVPEDVMLTYQIKGWVKNDTAAARELEEKVRVALGRRTYLEIPKRDAEDVERKLWLFQEGETVLLRERSFDELIYQTAWTYTVRCELDRGGEVVEKTVKTLEMGLWNGLEADTDKKKYRSFQYDDSTFTPVEE